MTPATTTEMNPTPSHTPTREHLLLVISWLWVGIPLAWGVYSTLMKSLVLFQ
jgi:hypothetical protein